MEYGDIKVQPLAYQDDIMKGSKDMLGAQAGNVKLATMLKDKVLSAHPDKTCYIVRGSKKFKEKVDKDIQTNPIVFDSVSIKQHVSDKDLGQWRAGGQCISYSQGKGRKDPWNNHGNKINCGKVPNATHWWVNSS